MPQPRFTIALTGASGGIGSALAEAYAAPGTVLALSGRDSARLEAVAERCRANGATVLTACVDVTDPAATRSWVAAVDDAHPIDLLIANAGISSSIGPGGEPEPWEIIERVMSVNAVGCMAAASAAAERMLPRRRGQIALMSSIAAYRGLPACPSYSASKAAVKAYAEGLRGWLAPHRIGVTVICPGYVTSPMSERVVGPKPFLVPADRAAALIRRRLERNPAEISFPFPLDFGTRLLSRLPSWAAERILPFFHFHVRPQA